MIGPRSAADDASPRRAAVYCLARLVGPLVPVIAALTVWAPLRDSYFFGDDFSHFYDAATLSFADFATQIWGGHLSLVRNSVLRAMFLLFGTDPRPYFWSVLLTHALNAFLLHRVIHRFTGDAALACFGATLWAACPILDGALGWYSVYGQVLLTTVVLGVLCSLADRPERAAPVLARTALVWTVLLALGSTCFGMGLGVAAVFPVVVALVLPREQLPRRSLAVLVLGAVVTVVGYALILTYSSRVSSLEHRLFSIPSVLAALPAVLALQVRLIGFGTAALAFDLVGWREQLPSWTQPAGAACLLLLLGVGWRNAAGSTRRLLLALLMLVGGIYGVVAAGRVEVFAFIGMPLATAAAAPRYQYLPVAVLAVLVSTALAPLTASGRVTARVVHGALGLWIIVRSIAFVAHPFSINHWDAQRAETDAMLESIHDQVARSAPGTVVRIENHPFGYSSFIPDPFPGWAGMFVVFFPANILDGRPVRFLVSDADWQRAQARGGRIAALVERQ